MREPLKLPDQKGSDGASLINLVVGCTGSIAAIKVPELVRKLHATRKFNIILLPSNDSRHFFNLQSTGSSNAMIDTLDSDLPGVTVFKDEDEYRFWHCRDDPVLHIEIRRWADILLIAPLSADTLAKINNGRCNTLLLEVLRAWDYTNLSEPTPATHHTKTHATHTFKQSNKIPERRLIACPAMNTHMYTHPLTAGHLHFLQETLHFELLGPIEKRLACGDLGTGGMSEVSTIVEHLSLQAEEVQAIKSTKPLETSMQDKVLAGLDEDAVEAHPTKPDTDKRLGWGKEEQVWAQKQRAFDEAAKEEKESAPLSDYDQRIRDQLDE